VLTALLLASSSGCSPPTLEALPQDTGGPRDTGETGSATDSGDTEDTIEDIGSPPELVYTQDEVHALDIRLGAAAIRALSEDPWTYVEGAVTFDGADFDSVGVRLKGAWGSFEDLSGKANFKVDFNRYVDGQTLWGIEQLTVNNNVVDCSFLRENLAYRVVATVGLHETRTAYVSVRVNEEDYGLYVLVETPDDSWLDRTFADPSGNLYDGKYIFTEDWDFVSMVDFTPALQDYFELEEGTDVQRADIHAVTEALQAARTSPDGFTDLGELIDWEQVLRVWASELWIGQLDGYWLNQNNYRVYFNPASGLVEMLPWDMDYAFYHDSDWGMNWHRPSGQLAAWCLQDPACRTRLEEISMDVIERVDAAGLDLHLEEMVQLITPYVSEETRACTRLSEVERRQDEMRRWIDERSDEVRAIWEE